MKIVPNPLNKNNLQRIKDQAAKNGLILSQRNDQPVDWEGDILEWIYYEIVDPVEGTRLGIVELGNAEHGSYELVPDDRESGRRLKELFPAEVVWVCDEDLFGFVNNSIQKN